MVNMVGFQSSSPFERIEHHRFGEAGWSVSATPQGWAVRYSNTHAHAVFGGKQDARDYVDHPGDIAIFARLHLALADSHYRLPREFNSQEVTSLIGEGAE